MMKRFALLGFLLLCANEVALSSPSSTPRAGFSASWSINKKSTERFDGEDESLMSAIASHVAVAMERARLTSTSEMLGGIRAVPPGSHNVTLTWVPADFLEAQNVAPWSQMPVWIPPAGEYAAFGRRSNKRAIAAGLTFVRWPRPRGRRWSSPSRGARSEKPSCVRGSRPSARRRS